jgi:hypothetical protein
MKYLLLLSNAASEWDRWRELSPEEALLYREAELPRWNELFGWIAEQGLDVQGLELTDPAAARVVRLREGEPIVTDGPYAETKEVLGGYFVADCEDLDQAIELARRVPVAAKGSVEIRPLVEA